MPADPSRDMNDQTAEPVQVPIEVLPHSVQCPHCDQPIAAMVLNNRAENASVLFVHVDGQTLMRQLQSGELFAIMQQQTQEAGHAEVPEGAQGAGAG